MLFSKVLIELPKDYFSALQSHGELPSKTKPSAYLLIVIMSSPNDTMVRSDLLKSKTILASFQTLLLNIEKDNIFRNTIRNTWLKLTAKPRHVVDHIFPVGVKGLRFVELFVKLCEKYVSPLPQTLFTILRSIY